MTDMIAENMYDYLEKVGPLPEEKKGFQKKLKATF